MKVSLVRFLCLVSSFRSRLHLAQVNIIIVANPITIVSLRSLASVSYLGRSSSGQRLQLPLQHSLGEVTPPSPFPSLPWSSTSKATFSLSPWLSRWCRDCAGRAQGDYFYGCQVELQICPVVILAELWEFKIYHSPIFNIGKITTSYCMFHIQE